MRYGLCTNQFLTTLIKEEFRSLPISFVEGDIASCEAKILVLSENQKIYQHITSTLQTAGTKSWSPTVLEKQHAYAYLEVMQNA